MELVVIMYCISYHYPHPIPPLAACCSKSVAAYRAIIVINIIFMTIVLVTFGVVGASQAPLRILCQQTFHNAIQELEIFTFRWLSALKARSTWKSVRIIFVRCFCITPDCFPTKHIKSAFVTAFSPLAALVLCLCFYVISVWLFEKVLKGGMWRTSIGVWCGCVRWPFWCVCVCVCVATSRYVWCVWVLFSFWKFNFVTPPRR